MSQKIYIVKIFKAVVKIWFQAHHNFVLKKDINLGHRIRKSIIICK